MNLQPVIWSEGMLLSPQHFQQQERFLRRHAASLMSMSFTYHQGFYDLALDAQLLRQGKIALRCARGIMPDATPFDMPAEHDLPAPVNVSAEQCGATVFLVLPLDHTARGGAERGISNTRYHPTSIDSVDENCAQGSSQTIDVGKPDFRLVVADSPPGDSTCLGVAHIQGLTATGEIVLDDCYIPSVLSCHASSALLRSMTDLLSQLQLHAATLASYLNERPHDSAGRQWLLAQCNRHALLLAHFIQQPFVHPYQFFLFLLQLCADCTSGHTQNTRPHVPSYHHGNLRHTFEPLFFAAKASLERCEISTASCVPFHSSGKGLLTAQLDTVALGEGFRAVLAIRSDLPLEQAQHKLATAIKVAPADRIRQLINLQLPGAKLLLLTTPPCEIHFAPGHCYFEIDRNTAIWNDLKTTASIALHTPAGLGEIDAALWLLPT